MQYFSEWKQDIIIDRLLKHKTDGTFVDIGANQFNTNNNSYFFELNNNFYGIGVDIDPQYAEGWAQNRKSPLIIGDATQLDYTNLFIEHNLPKVIDFLSIDVDPAETSLDALYKVFETDYQFNIVDFEVANDPPVTQKCKSFLESKGYKLVKELHIYGHYHLDDIYVHESIYNENMIEEE
jgi:hypothetical protein